IIEAPMVGQFIVFAIVTFAWIFFRSSDLSNAYQFIKGIFYIQNGSALLSGVLFLNLLVCVLIHFKKINKTFFFLVKKLPISARIGFYLFCAAIIALLAPARYKAFIYFQF